MACIILLKVEGTENKSPHTDKVRVFCLRPENSFESFNLGFSMGGYSEYM